MYLALEAAYGVTPDTPLMKPIRHNSTTVGLTKNRLQSEELRSDRQIAGSRYGTQQVGGDIVAELTYGGTMHDMLEAVLCGTWTEAGAVGEDGDTLKAGTTRRAFSIMRNFGDLGAGNKPYHIAKGVEFNTFNLAVGTEGIVQATFGVVGQDYTTSENAPAGTTYDPVPVTEGMDSFTGAITEGGVEIAVVTEMELSLENGIEPRFVVGSKKTIKPSIGRSIVTGQITAHFETGALLDKFLSETSSNLEFTLGDGTNSYTFKLPNIAYTGGQPDVEGEGSILLTMPFEAQYSAADVSQIVITRTGA